MSLAALQADFGRWLQHECAAAAARLGGGPGLDVYLNNYRSQLVSALESGFPQLRGWLGGAAFRSAAAHHVEAFPPRAWTLDAYGADFAETLAVLYPDDAECVELARIEWGLATAFTAPDADPIAADALGTVAWEEARLRFVPSLATVPVATNAAALWQALAGEAPPPSPEWLPEPAVVLLWRRGFHPAFRTVERDEADALMRLRAGERFGVLCERLAGLHGAGPGATRAGEWLGGWLRDGMVAAVA